MSEQTTTTRTLRVPFTVYVQPNARKREGSVYLDVNLSPAVDRMRILGRNLALEVLPLSPPELGISLTIEDCRLEEDIQIELIPNVKDAAQQEALIVAGYEKLLLAYMPTTGGEMPDGGGPE